MGAGGVRRLPPRFRAAAARVGFPAASPPAAERAAPGEGPRAGGRARLEVAFSSSTSAFRGGVSSYPARSSAGPGGRVSPGRAPRAPPAPAGGARSAPPKAAAQRPPLLPRAGEAGGAAPGTGRASPRRAARPAERRSFAPAAAAADPGSLPEVRREREGERAVGGGPGSPGGAPRRGYLVDPASSICLSQRLSHACLSTHGRYSETANGSLNQLWFLWSLPSRYLDNCGNSRANTCRRAPTSGDACIYQTKTNPGSPGGFGDSR